MATQDAIRIRPGKDTVYQFRPMTVPDMRRGAVRVKVRRCGECPTIYAVLGGMYGAPPPGDEWLTPGHEIFAEITEMDDQIPEYLRKQLRIGQRVMVSVRVPGPNATGLALTAPHLCSDSSKGWVEHGLYGANGGYTREMVIDAHFVYPLPDALTDQVAVLSEGAVCVQTAVQRGIRHQLATLDGIQWPHAKIALVLGAGPASLMATIFYTMLGYSVVVVSRKAHDDPKSKRLIRMGARYVQSESRPGFIAEVATQYGPFSQVFNGTGVADARLWRQAVDDTGAFVEYSIPDKACFMNSDFSKAMVHEVTTSSCSVGSINCDPRLWQPSFIALQWAMAQWPWLTEDLFCEVPFDSKAPAGILDAVNAGWFKPMVVME